MAFTNNSIGMAEVVSGHFSSDAAASYVKLVDLYCKDSSLRNQSRLRVPVGLAKEVCHKSRGVGSEPDCVPGRSGGCVLGNVAIFAG
jgi:hypothetical protein